MLESRKRLSQFNRLIADEDPDISMFDEGVEEETFVPQVETAELDDDEVFTQESIIMRRQRPVLKVQNNQTVLEFIDQADSQLWRPRLEAAAPRLDPAIRAIGRINLRNAPYEWVGTGWLVDDDIVVTNRHVADLFVVRGPSGLVFEQFDGQSTRREIDFLEEFDSAAAAPFELIEPLHIVQKPGPDIAFFRVARQSTEAGDIGAPIALAAAPSTTASACVIGYPAYDSRIPDIDLMEEIYGREYNKKRLAPGAVTFLQGDRLLHNCTTLGGNSGSAVINLDTGEAMGLHFSGRFLATNYAVRADVVGQELEKVRSGRLPEAMPRPSELPPGDTAQNVQMQIPSAGGGQSVSINIPLTVTVTVGQPTVPAQAKNWSDDGFFEAETEAPESYADRPGYDPDFLGEGERRCPLPKVTNMAQDMLTFADRGNPEETELRYQHFSVVMSRSRRMCFFSAVNIDGSKAQSDRRVGWRWDSRIPRSQQIMKECYGNPPRFSRGHMTRRNDPGWGTDEMAELGNRDSMHVTNATPQMQSFNAPIWLELEDYALENAIEDGQKICVFTGPYLQPTDPTRFGVQVPVRFWKVIAFIHDQTGKLTATGYAMDQTDNLPPPDAEFVFGDFTSSHTGEAAQVAISEIEREAGLFFGGLADLDPFGQTESGLGPVRPSPIRSGADIMFI
ncbi:MAG: DNA/RNA non-specific endonuclease [Pseudomonadota bacterium]